MSTDTEPRAPRIRNAGTNSTNPRKLFVNIPVANLQRSIEFFEELGFTFNLQFTDATATSMLVGEDAYFMLLQTERFKSFTERTVGDPHKDTSAIFAISVGTRAEVDELVNKALAGGGTDAMPPQDHGFMYGRSFYDLDGHHWEVFYMDRSMVQG